MEKEIAYALLHQGKTIPQIERALNASRRQVMRWICEASAEATHHPTPASDPSLYEHQLGKRKWKVYPES